VTWKGIGCYSRHDAQWCEQAGLGVYHDGAKRIRAVLALFVTPEDASSCAADNVWVPCRDSDGRDVSAASSRKNSDECVL
jgi:hypothetical protein